MNKEWECHRCGDEIDAPDITGLLCSACWLSDQDAPTVGIEKVA